MTWAAWWGWNEIPRTLLQMKRRLLLSAMEKTGEGPEHVNEQVILLDEVRDDSADTDVAEEGSGDQEDLVKLVETGVPLLVLVGRDEGLKNGEETSDLDAPRRPPFPTKQ